MVTALYRRYRPETFAEMIGQSQVTEPLMTALRTNRVNHAYLFSGPRGCGKTTSARILARCLNCAEGPTDTPCGRCESCIELGRGGQGSLDVVEIDAASHNGVDDARDIRERAIFAPARDRYKIFILDEAHMVTPQGFNALLKIVEEPPEHVKFIFATTEPDKVIGTIRSRTHHYPFRLVPPAQMLDYVQQLCESEGMSVAPGVLPLVVRAGGGSPRDTLSLLDQLIAGSEGETIEYERAVALLGYTHAALLDEVVDALGAADAASAFAAVDRVIQTGQDPRRFVEDLLERLRDLIIVAATSPGAAAAVLRGTPQEELDRMFVQASSFGSAELSRCADIANAALTEMTGATSPRLHLELMIARMLVPSSDATDRGALARVERLERRVGVESGAAAATDAAVSRRATEAPALVRGESAPSLSAPTPAADPATVAAATAPDEIPAPSSPGEPVTSASAPAGESADPALAQAAAFAAAAAATKRRTQPDAGTGGGAASEWAAPGVTDDRAATPVGPVTTQQVKDAWPEILDAVAEVSRSAWAVVYTSTVRGLQGDVLSLSFPSANDVESFRGRPGAKDAASEVLRQAIVDLLGIRVKFVAKPAGSDGGSGGSRTGGSNPAGPESRRSGSGGSELPGASGPGPTTPGASGGGASSSRPVAPASSSAVAGWATVAIPGSPAATAVLDRPERADLRAAAVGAEDASSPRDTVASSARFADGGWGRSIVPDVEPSDADAPDEDEPPFPDDLPEHPVPASGGSADIDPPGASPSDGASAVVAATTVSDGARGEEERHGGRTKTSVGFREPARYGEAVVRELLGARFIEEQEIVPPAGRQGAQPGWAG